ncbi:hypothetical protein EP10_003251 [Geobacillus icigianus]|uniref:Uncharacterized protein n=1 Tax=Geobacillus icigianus TaxID=1430331 RepID=A0ABU6BKA5_9BACL|nr:hypothetical protein [Geobacillus icigianus]
MHSGKTPGQRGVFPVFQRNASLPNGEGEKVEVGNVAALDIAAFDATVPAAFRTKHGHWSRAA